jgi:hypothetical protein
MKCVNVHTWDHEPNIWPHYTERASRLKVRSHNSSCATQWMLYTLQKPPVSCVFEVFQARDVMTNAHNGSVQLPQEPSTLSFTVDVLSPTWDRLTLPNIACCIPPLRANPNIKSTWLQHLEEHNAEVCSGFPQLLKKQPIPEWASPWFSSAPEEAAYS